MITLNNINLSSIDLSGIDLRGIKLGLGGRGGGSGDGFPQLPGDVTRWYFGGLTNEMMAAMDDPRIEDADHKGRFLSFKNFAWKGMSGVGGYGDENYQTFYKFTLDDYVFIASPPGVEHMNFTFRVTGLQPGNKLTLAFFGTTNTVYGTWDKDGIYTVDADIVEAGKPTYFYNGYGATRGEFTIEILPLYPGALVFDGVDDYGTCNNFPILTKEKGYTVVVLRQWDQDFLNTTLTGGLLSTRNYSTGEGVAFEKIESSNKGYWNLGAGGIIDFAKSPFTWQTSKQYNNVGILKGDKNHGKPLCVGCGLSGGQQCGRFAIWELVFLDHDATEEELTKIKDYFVKTYPWLFPYQAWTVVGKTNEDEDRATIANITGNGNDLVLSNFGFAKGSGYGLYYQYFGEKFATTNGEIEDGGWNKIDNYNISHNKRIPINSIGKCYWSNEVFANGIKLRFKLTGMTEGDVLAFGYAATYDLTYTSDGIYAIDLPPVDKPYGFSLQSFLTENLPTTPVTIELLPFEYEGYLVTDGVDDEVRSAAFTLNEDWTIVGNWEFITNENKNAGLTKVYSFYLYNRDYGIFVYEYLNAGQGFSVEDVKSLKAICSDGRIYLNDWQEIRNNKEQEATISKGVMAIGYFNRDFTKMAFKNLGIYNNQILSKDDCIKAYKYLQTLKAK